MKTNINISLENQKKYQIILNNLINSKFSNKTIESIYSIDMKNEFLNYFQMNIKKSSFKAQILPSIAFFLVSLVSFSVEVLIKNNVNFGVKDNINNFRVCNLVFGAFFLLLGIMLLIQKFIFKIKVIYISNGRNKGYINLSYNKYKKIVNLICKCKDKVI